MSNKNVYKLLEEKEKIITYVIEQFRAATGNDIALPQAWSSFLGFCKNYYNF